MSEGLGRYGVVEELGNVIGYTATAMLVDWFGGGNLHVPVKPDPENPIAKIIGEPALRRLVGWMDEQSGGYRDRLLWIPMGYHREQDRRDRMIAVLFHLGLGSDQIGKIAGMSRRHVQDVRKRVEEMGVLPLILRKSGVKTPRKTRG